jgi:MFS family permease
MTRTVEILRAPGLRSVFEFRIVVPSITCFLYNFLWGTTNAFVPLYAIESGVSNPGYFFSSVALMIIAGRTGASRILDIYSKRKIVLVFLGVSTTSMILLSFSTNLPMLVLSGLFWGTGSSFFYPAMMAYAFEYAGCSDGPAVSAYRAVSDLGMALGPVTMGLIIPLTGYRMMFICLALICAVNMIYFQFCVRKKVNALELP